MAARRIRIGRHDRRPVTIPAMFLLAIATSILLAASMLIALLVWLGRRAVAGRWPDRFWRRTLRWHIPLTVLYLFVVVPGLLGWFATSQIGTRGDERRYVGPYLDAGGHWRPQYKEEDEGGVRETADPGGRFVSPTMVEGAEGLRVRVFLVPPDQRRGTRPYTAVIAHGLFRGAMEVDPVGSIFRDLGCEVCIVETRNHGRSDRGPATFGPRESDDLLAVTKWLRARPGTPPRRPVLFGVSLGAAVVALAAPEVEGLAAIVLEAPMDELEGTIDRVLRVRAGMPRPFRWLTRTSLSWWAGIDLADVRPVDALLEVAPEVAALIIGGSEDVRMPPDVVRRSYALPSKGATKALWIREGSGHGSVWKDDPDGYRRRLGALLDRIR